MKMRRKKTKKNKDREKKDRRGRNWSRTEERGRRKEETGRVIPPGGALARLASSAGKESERSVRKQESEKLIRSYLLHKNKRTSHHFLLLKYTPLSSPQHPRTSIH